MRFYLPALAKGLGRTLRYLFARTPSTLEYPEQRRVPRPGYRGEHYLKVDGEGRVKCVACHLCATACPSHCIKIVAAPAPWPDREKYPSVFEIDMLRCIYCGMCEEACPCDAIALTPKFNTVMTSRGEGIYDKERLVANAPAK